MPKFHGSDKGGKDFVRYNDRIRIPQVLVVQDGKNLGVMATRDALAKARSVGLDLVEVAPHARPPVCSIMDYGKYMYDRQKRSKSQSHQSKEKEISFRYVIDQHDLETKANQVRRFLEKGIKVKVVVKFKAREKAHKDQGFVAIQKLLSLLEDVAAVEKAPTLEGNNIIARLDVKKGAGNESQKPSKEANQTPESNLRE
jgi:translation initiation factor IF-3